MLTLFNNKAWMYLSGDGSTNVNLGSTVSVQDGAWHHLVATYDPGVSIRVIVDNGTPDEKTTSIPASMIDTTAQFILGSWGTLASNFSITGDIDEAALWSRVLTADEITELYNSGNGIGYPA
jgi:hypothetical protein